MTMAEIIVSKFVPFPRAVSKAFRELVLTRYPALRGGTPRARAYRAITEYALFNNHVNRGGTGEIVLPFCTVARLVGANPRSRGFSAGRWIEDFSADVFPLHARTYRYTTGEARIIAPEVAPEILKAQELELAEDLGPDYKRVYFVDGARVTQRRRREEAREYVRQLRELVDVGDSRHPARDLLHFLNAQPPDTLEKFLRLNWADLRRAALNMPEGTDQERARRDAALRVLLGVADHRVMLYGTSSKTIRLHALGNNLHLLPRELRKLALRGAIQLDLRACQLAVVAKLWDIPVLQAFLAQGKSIWKELLTYTGLGEEFKPILKRSIYSILFGMGRRRLRQQLDQGADGDPGVGPGKRRAFFRHPLIVAVMRARTTVQKRVHGAGGTEDAFGRWISTDEFNLPSVLAQQVQSYEVRLMLAMLPVLKAEKDIRVISWLHDGVAVQVLDPAERERKVRRLCDAVREAAEAYGFHTELEVEM